MEEFDSSYQKSVKARATDSIGELRGSMSRKSPRSPRPSPGRGGHESPRRLQDPQQQSRSTWDQSPTTNDYSYRVAVDRLRSMLNKQESSITSGPLPWDLASSPRPGSPSRADQFQYGRSPSTHQSPAAFSKSKDAVPLYPPFVLRRPQDHSQEPSGAPGNPGPAYDGIPGSDELVPLLQHQGNYIQQLEGENKYCKDELMALKLRLGQIVEENRNLYEQLKAGIAQSLLGEETEVQDSASVQPQIKVTEDLPATQPESQVPSESGHKHDLGKWKKELERLTALHSAKSNRLETQLLYTKSELQKHEKLVEELKGRLRMQESLNLLSKDGRPPEPGLCIRCAQSDALLPPSSGSNSTIDRITKERDDLINSVTHLKARLEEAQKREESAYEQMKLGLEVVDKAHLEKTQVLVDKEHLRSEVKKMTERMQEYSKEMAAKMDEERAIVRKECGREIEELNQRLKEMTEQKVGLETQVDKIAREKISILAELEQAKRQIDTFDSDYNRTSDNIKVSMTQASVERDVAVGEMNRLRAKLDKQKRDKEQGTSRLQAALDAVRRRLGQAEREAVDSKEQCIKLTTTNQALEREAHMAKMSKDSVERGRSEDLASMSRRAERREEELNAMITQMETRNGQTVQELEAMVTAQNSLVSKLREECRHLAGKLEHITDKYRNENKQLKAKNEELSFKAERNMKKLKDMEGQQVQHGRLHEKMKRRLKQMDEHAHHSSQQIVDLLGKQTHFMREKQLLAKEVEFLRHQVSKNQSDVDKLYKGSVDKILDGLKNDEDISVEDLALISSQSQLAMADLSM